MAKNSLKDKVDGKSLDLSLTELKDVPVDELATLYKANHLDMSCNIITRLPDDFGRLTHLVHLDLSKNQLIELPMSIGNLHKLVHLDLYSNKLNVLPVSMWRMKSLRWLDLKDNPLEASFAKTAGNCLDDTQCKTCAKKVVQLLKMVKKQQDEEEEQERQAELERQEEAEREAEEARRSAEEEENMVRRRKQEAAEEKLMEDQENIDVTNDSEEPYMERNQIETQVDEPAPKKSALCRYLLNTILLCSVLMVFLYLVCKRYTKQSPICQSYTQIVHYWHAQLSGYLDTTIIRAKELLDHLTKMKSK